MQNWRNVLWWAGLAIILVAVLWFVPQWQGRYFSQGVPAKEVPALVNEYRRTWAQIIGGFVLLLGLYFTWRRIEISQQELEATRDQQVTERFTRAIDQLGATDDDGKPRLEIRLGGIYALERIAIDSLSMENFPGRDYSTVMEVLTAYVRENTHQGPGPPKGTSEAASTSNEATSEAEAGSKQPAPPEARRPTADIQAILDVLGRTQALVPEEYRTRLDLHESILQGARLQEANLEGARLQDTNLQRAYLQGANLLDATLMGADLQGAYLQGANLLGAYLQGANLLGAHLQGANLQGAYLLAADLREAYLQGTLLQGAHLPMANLQRADLQEANLLGANLLGANLQGANLLGATGLSQEQLGKAVGNKGTRLPRNLKTPAHWGVKTAEQIEED